MHKINYVLFHLTCSCKTTNIYTSFHIPSIVEFMLSDNSHNFSNKYHCLVMFRWLYSDEYRCRRRHVGQKPQLGTATTLHSAGKGQLFKQNDRNPNHRNTERASLRNSDTRMISGSIYHWSLIHCVHTLGQTRNTQPCKRQTHTHNTHLYYIISRLGPIMYNY